MATASTPEEINAERRKRVFLGSLPPDFLRISATSQQQQEAADQQTALALQQQLAETPFMQNMTGRLNITVAQAKLVKNYGMTRMDPYVRLRVGHCVYETHTDPNGGKNPSWNKVVQCLLPQGVNSLYLEIYDECSFTMDELVAWAQIPIPEVVFTGETHDEWYPLNGKQGDGQEGMINLVLSYTKGPMNPYGMYGGGVVPPVMMVPSTTSPIVYGRHGAPCHTVLPYAAVPVYTQPLPPPAPPLKLSEADLKQVEEMFPNMDKEVVKSVYEANRGNKDATVNSLLQMCE